MNTDLTDITLVLDRSGSMSTVREDTIGGFNTFLSDQKAVPGRADMTLVQFNEDYEVLYEGKPLHEAPLLTPETFVPGGGTALLDAVGRAMNAAGVRLAAQPEEARAGKVLFVVMTDGEENSSTEFTSKQVFDMVTHQREKYGWQVVFIGANQDAIAAGAGYGIPQTNALNYNATSAGTRAASASLSAATSRYRGMTAPQSDDFFAEESETEKEG